MAGFIAGAKQHPSGGSFNLTLPAGAVLNGWCLVIAVNGSSTAITDAIAGSTVLLSAPANNMYVRVLAKQLTSTDITNGFLAVTLSTTGEDVWILAYDTSVTGFDSVNSFPLAASAYGTRGGVSQTFVDAPTVTPNVGGDYCVLISVERTTATGTTVSSIGQGTQDYYNEDTVSTNASVLAASFTGPGGGVAISADRVTYSGASGNALAFLLPMTAAPTAAVALGVATNLAVVVPGARTAAVPLAVGVSLGVIPATPVQAWLRDTVPMAAHRGGSADWPEETLYAYGQSAAWSPRLALEVSVWQSSDGVWVCSHDQTTGRVFGTDYDIPTTPWSTLQSLRTTSGNLPIARLDDVLSLYATGNRVLFIDNKGVQSVAAFFTLLDSYGGNTRFVIKSFQSGTAIAAQAHSRGYITWGYYFETDVPSLPSTQASWDLLGMDYTASGAAWASVLSYGKTVLGHIIPDAAAKTTALGKGATALMVSGVKEAVPQVGAGATVPLGIGVSLAVAGQRSGTVPIALGVRTVLGVVGSGGTVLVRDITIRPGPALTRYAAGPAVT